MATQSGPKGDWHRTWQAIHHQSHVAIGLCTASFSDLFVCACECNARAYVGALPVCLTVFCVRAIEAALSQQNRTDA